MLKMLPFIDRFSQHSVVHMDKNVQSTFMELLLREKPLTTCISKSCMTHAVSCFVFTMEALGSVKTKHLRDFAVRVLHWAILQIGNFCNVMVICNDA